MAHFLNGYAFTNLAWDAISMGSYVDKGLLMILGGPLDKWVFTPGDVWKSVLEIEFDAQDALEVVYQALVNIRKRNKDVPISSVQWVYYQNLITHGFEVVDLLEITETGRLEHLLEQFKCLPDEQEGD